MRVLILGATGTIGRATATELVRRGHEVVPMDRAAVGALGAQPGTGLPEGIEAVVSCMASRSGTPVDARAVDHAAHAAVLRAAVAAGVGRWVQLSAICVQRPTLPFQRAKLAFEAELAAAPLAWTVVRPTAFFKSLSGQVARVAQGRPFLVFGDGRLTSCKPVSNRDLAHFLASTLEDQATHGRILPIGGPGPAITPLDQAAMLERLLGRKVQVRRVPIALLGVIATALAAAGLVSGRAREKAELARIGRYYATESMLVWNPVAGRYDAEATPETGADRLEDHYAALLAGHATDDRGAHAVF
jgi:divinyl chlorophyllide a 8-vinyl-reductase